MIGLALPWMVHLAPPRHRPIALIAAIAIVILYTVLRANAFLTWELWAGLAAGVVSVVFLAPGRREEPPARRREREEPWADDGDTVGLTGEFARESPDRFADD